MAAWMDVDTYCEFGDTDAREPQLPSGLGQWDAYYPFEFTYSKGVLGAGGFPTCEVLVMVQSMCQVMPSLDIPGFVPF